MTKKHIIEFGYRTFACDSLTSATQAVALLSKLEPVQHNTSGGYDNWHYTPEEDNSRPREVSLKLNQPYRAKKVPKPAKVLALPRPARGTIRCICEKSDVAPKQSCPHCGRPFSESLNRTHGTQA